MAVAHRATSFVIGSTPGTNSNIVATEPTGAASGDYLLALAIMEEAGSTSITAPGGWTVLKSGSAGGTVRWIICAIVRGGSAPSYTFTTVSSSGHYYEVHVSAFSGAHATQPDSEAAAIASGVGNRSQCDPPSTTAVSSAAMAVAIGMHWDGSLSPGWTAPSGYTLRSDNTISNDGIIATKLLSSSGAENPGVFTSGAAGSNVWIAHTITVAPAASGQSVTLTPATETDAAIGLSFIKPIRVTLTPATEANTPTALSITHPIILTLTPAAETDTVPGIGAAHIIPYSPATETDTPVGLAPAKSVTFVPAVETDAAVASSFTKPIIKTLGTATETDVAVALVYAISGTHFITLTPAVEDDEAVPLNFSVVGGGLGNRPRYYIQRMGRHSVKRRTR